MRSTFLALLTLLSATLSPTWQEPVETPKAGPRVGSPAPALRLNDQSGHAQSIGGESDHWTVLAFYPKAATPG